MIETANPTPRFPGAQPFEENQHALFFGREEAIETLYHLIRQEPLVILYGKSGMGKSSLLNAGLVPKLRTLGKHQPLRVRFNAFTGEETMPAIATQEVVRKGEAAVDTFLDKLIENDNSLWHDLKEQQIITKGEQSVLLIFDQFEELFTYPQEAQFAFRKQLAEALYTPVPQRCWDVLDLYQGGQSPLSQEELTLLQQPLNLRVIIAIRQDRMHLLGNLADYIPTINKNWYELEPLSEKAAVQSIQAPAAADGNFSSPPFTFSEGALKAILRFLTKNGSQKIENTQLQIVCHSLEKKVVKSGLDKISEDQLDNLDAVIENYYEEKIASVTDLEQQSAARRLVEKGLIFEEDQRRLSMYEGQIFKEYKLSSATLRALVNSHLLRAEPSTRGGYVYELSHDTMVPAVLNAKRRSEEVEKQAEEQRRQLERELEFAEERKKRKRTKLYASILGVVAIIALLAGFFAMRSLNNLRKANASVVELMLKDADRHILELRYDDALNTIKAAEKLKVLPTEVANAYLEIAFFFGESGQQARAIGILDTVARLSGENAVRADLKNWGEKLTTDTWLKKFRDLVQILDSTHYTLLQQRYYPVLVDVKGGDFSMGRSGERYLVTVGDFKMAATETTYWQWFLYCTANDIDPNRRGFGTQGTGVGNLDYSLY